ncbi:Short/branched chain specific acyl-CoA dehydrogenase [Phytophthora rubi]|uniref:Short/branched chain specific acyl-CoA dehydrogenase, mitochondrial n=1 Tax=Phytophthora rubi TaxID=129364 RepID=A0A6A3NJ98_9STRA|nr:Short/branched chain specific acyl-CoA dehydrogenase [Phytophthora rubi]KAE9042299.1 Short/branched chain specific acyl-CoA dehydrogenase [Phytophthora rubi]KAE9341237.1 Short/branched chain specific acyl-CoA dehydrogenase [Phytophthora rubi]
MLSNVLIKTQRRVATRLAVSGARRWGSSVASPSVEALQASPMPLTVLTEEEQMFKDSVARFAADVIQPSVRSMDEAGEMTPEVIQGLFDNGLLSVEIPMEYGGVGASFMSLILTIEELSRVDASVGLLCDLQNTVVSNVFLRYATEEQRREFLPRLCTDTVGSFCLTEAEAGSDAFSLKTRADVSADGSHYTLNGEKMWISNVAHADVFLVMANVDPSLGYKGITCFIVERGTPGLSFGPPEKKLGLNASSTCSVILEDVKVPTEKVLGKVGQGYAIAIGQLNEGRIGIAAQQLGIAEGAYRHAMPYLFQRKQFGRAIGDFQAMQHQYAELVVDLASARLLVYNAARLKDAGHDYVKASCMAKLHASRVAERTASRCIEMLGGVGFSKQLMAEKFYRDCKVGTIYGGTSNVQLSTIARLTKQELV